MGFDLVWYDEYESAVGNDNVLKPEWLSIFSSVHTVTIVAGYAHKFSFEALLESMKAFPPSIGTVIVKDKGFWAQRTLTDDVAGLFVDSGWTAEYKDGRGKANHGSMIFVVSRSGV